MEGLFVSIQVLEYLYSKLIKQRLYTAGSCSQMSGASGNASLGDIMFNNHLKGYRNNWYNSPARDSEISSVVP